MGPFALLISMRKIGISTSSMGESSDLTNTSTMTTINSEAEESIKKQLPGGPREHSEQADPGEESICGRQEYHW